MAGGGQCGVPGDGGRRWACECVRAVVLCDGYTRSVH